MLKERITWMTQLDLKSINQSTTNAFCVLDLLDSPALNLAIPTLLQLGIVKSSSIVV